MSETTKVSLSEAKALLSKAETAEDFAALVHGLAERTVADDEPDEGPDDDSPDDPGELAQKYGRRLR